MRFTKMHGIGNDYVYINGFEESVEDPAALAREVTDRHTGVGGDGLVMILPAEDGTGADVRMRMFNADGSEAEMCGNAIRCVAKYAHDRGLTGARPMRVQTGAGVLGIEFETDGGGRLIEATVDMGEPILEAGRVPVALPGVGEGDRVVDYLFNAGVELEDDRMTAVSMGNPHVVFYCGDPAKLHLETIGPVIENHKFFPNRINVHFVKVHSPGEVTMRTWERGTGITLACGTGAAAVCVAGVLTGRTERGLLAHLPGGDLRLRWDADSNHVFKTGSATHVFDGEWPS